jgi:hypothetical protein
VLLRKARGVGSRKPARAGLTVRPESSTRGQAHVEAEVLFYPGLCLTLFGPISKVLRHETRTHLSYF